MFRDHRGIVCTETPELMAGLVVCPSESGYGRPRPFCVARRLGDGTVALPKMYPDLAPLAEDRYVSSEIPFPTFAGALDAGKGQHLAREACLGALRASGGCVLSLPTGYGKTVVALSIAAEIGMRTCVVVHTRALRDQWVERIAAFLPGATVGALGDTGCHFVVAMLQTACSEARLLPSAPDIGLTIVDEAHHIAAHRFSEAMLGLSSRYTLGLSATPNRKDGLTRLVFWFLGPLAYSAERSNESGVRVRRIHYRPSSYSRQPPLMWNGKPCVSRMVTDLTKDPDRNTVILDALALSDFRCALMLTDRREHAVSLVAGASFRLPGKAVRLYVGGMKKKDLQDAEERADVIVGTYSVAHEGLDIPRLDCLVLCTPKADVTQACGRVLRGGTDNTASIVDIVDVWSVFNRQAERRLMTYRKSGFTVV